MRDIWSFLLQTLTASGVAALLLAAKALFRDKLSPRWQFSVWGILAVILLVPAGLGGRYALVNWSFYIEAAKSALTGEFGTLSRVTAPVPLPPAAPPHTAEDWLFLVYLAGVAALLAHYGIAYARLRRALKRGRAADPSPIRAVAERYGLQACPVVEIEGLPSAFVCGVFRPVLALPAGGAVDEKVLLHELLHLQYRDAAWGLALCFFRCLHWCNPLLWLCAGLAGNDLESLCDQRVLERLEGEDRRDYGRILLSMADGKYARTPGTSSIANGGRNIRRRIEAIARFKRYPRGMGLVSVCVILVLAAPLLVGRRATAMDRASVLITDWNTAAMAAARTTWCTTYAGAFDAYAKAVLTEYIPYRAMCAPLAEQNQLAEACRAGPVETPRAYWERMNAGEAYIPGGYYIYNLVQPEEDVWEGLLAVQLRQPPDGPSLDSHYIWMALQRLRAEREGERWVIRPQEDFRAVEAVGWSYLPSLGCEQLPSWLYEAETEDFTVQVQRQSAAQIPSEIQTSNPLFSSSSFDSTPHPGGEFTCRYGETVLAVYTGTPEDTGRYSHIAASSFPLWEGDARPALRNPGVCNGGGGSTSGDRWGSQSLEEGWARGAIFLSGGGASFTEERGLPDAYAVDLYLNGELAAELTLTPSEGGLAFD